MKNVQIKVGKPKKPNKNPKLTYRFTFEAMSGDADHEDVVVVDVRKENPHLTQFLSDLPEGLNHNGDLIEDSPFGKWFDGSGINPSNQWKNNKRVGKEKDLLYVDWPRDVTCNDYYCAMWRGEISYFDEHGIEHEAELVITDEN